MADITVPYVWTTPWGTITFNETGIDKFNSYGQDEYYIGDEDGLNGAPLRTPTDNRPQTDGGLVHRRYKGPREIIISGAIVIRSTRAQNAIGAIRNQMEQDLIDAHSSIEDADGTLVWTPRGMSQKSLTVRAHNPAPDFDGIEWRTFVLGLIAADPVW